MKKIVAVLLAMLMLASLLPAYALPQSASGQVVHSVESDLAFVLPDGFVNRGPGQGFNVGYVNESMLIGVAPLPFTDLDTYHQERLPREMVDGESMTVNDVDVQWFTFKGNSGMCALLVLQAAPDKNLMELSFYPADMTAEEENRALVESILSTVRITSQTYADDQNRGQFIGVSHDNMNLKVLLPTSMVRVSPDQYIGDEISVYGNEFIRVHFYGYEATVQEYLDYYQMDVENYYVTDVTRNGARSVIYEPKPELNDQALCYCVVEGKDGGLLEIVFTAVEPYNEEACWFYINSILATVSTIE